MGKQARKRRERRDPDAAPIAAPAPTAAPWWQSPWRVGLAAVALVIMVISAASMMR